MSSKSNLGAAVLLGFIAGWVLQWFDTATSSFVHYALGLAITGLGGAALSGSIFAAPIGLIIGQPLATLLLPNVSVTPEILMAVPSAAIAVLAGMAGRPLHRRFFQREP